VSFDSFFVATKFSKQPLPDERNQSICPNDLPLASKKFMATYRDPVTCFSQLEVIERLLEIRGELGYDQAIYIPNSNELAGTLDAYGFDIYAFSTGNRKINYGDYRSPLVPGGDHAHTSFTAH